MRNWLVVFLCLMPLCVVFAVLYLASPDPTSTTRTVALSILYPWLVGICVSAFGVINGTFVARREFADGYTTMPYGSPHLDLVDYRTHLVLREAGEPVFSRPQYRAARSEARHQEEVATDILRHDGSNSSQCS